MTAHIYSGSAFVQLLNSAEISRDLNICDFRPLVGFLDFLQSLMKCAGEPERYR